MVTEKIEEINSKLTTLFQLFPVEAEVLWEDNDHILWPLKCPIFNDLKKMNIDRFLKNKRENSSWNTSSIKVEGSAETTIFKSITNHDKVIGVILVTPKPGQTDWLIQNHSIIETLLDIYSNWVSYEIENKALKNENTIVLDEMNGLFSFIQDPILIVGADGTINNLTNHVSKDFQEYKWVLMGQNITTMMKEADWLKIKKTKNQQDIRISLHLETLKEEAREYSAKVKPLLSNQDIVSYLIHLTPIKEKKKIHEQKVHYTFNDIKGTSSAIQSAIEIAKRVAPSDTSTLLRGESGTGKEMFAQSIHEASHRRNGPFIALNCAAIPESLLESELFGHVKGAFTGSMGDRPGRFELANGGTIFLDEIGDLSLHLQAKLLRVVQERKIERVGDTKNLSVNIRIITATHRNLEELVASGGFREDLYFRLNVISITIPPLKERREDIPILFEYFMKKFSKEYFRTPKRVTNDAFDILLDYQWSGNIRELQNVVHHLVQLEVGDLVTRQSLPKYLRDIYEREPKTETSVKVNPRLNLGKTQLDEKDLILELLDQYGRDTLGKKKVARHMNISMATLYRRISKLNIK